MHVDSAYIDMNCELYIQTVAPVHAPYEPCTGVNALHKLSNVGRNA